MMRWIGLCIFSLLCTLQAVAIEAVTSHAIFYTAGAGKPVQPYIEIYWQIDPNTIHVAQRPDSLWQAQIKTDIIFKNEAGAVVMEDHFVLATPAVKNYNDAFAQNIMDLHRYMLPAGKINIQLTLAEKLLPENKYTYAEDVDIPVPGDAPYFSSIQLLDTVYNSTNENVFFKNGKHQVPFPSSYLDDNKKLMHVYAELYGTDKISTDEYPIVKHLYVSKKAGEGVVFQLNRKDTIQAGGVIPIMHDFNIAPLPSGNYYINLLLENKQHATLATKTLFIQRSNLNPTKIVKEEDTTEDGYQKINVFDPASTFAGKYKMGQLKAIMKMLLPIANPIEIKNIEGFGKKPDESFMRYFLFNFWKGRNEKDPEKEWLKYTEQVKEVNKLFSGSNKQGFQTERGYTYLKYGKPLERVVVENEPGTLPYEIWLYNYTEKQGSKGIFLFYRPSFMIGDYQLLHSTVKGEKRNTNWRLSLYVNQANGSGSTNPRAEQYLENTR